MRRHRSVGSALFCGRATLYALAAYHMLRTPLTLASLPKGEWRSFVTVYIDSGRCVCAANATLRRAYEHTHADFSM